MTNMKSRLVNLMFVLLVGLVVFSATPLIAQCDPGQDCGAKPGPDPNPQCEFDCGCEPFGSAGPCGGNLMPEVHKPSIIQKLWEPLGEVARRRIVIET